MKPIQMVDLYGQYLRLKEQIDTAIENIIQSTAFINGQPVKDFASDLENYLDVKHVIPCGNGTDALQIALMALELKPGDEVITSNFTFIATVEVLALLKLKPVLVDVDPETFNLDPEKTGKAITSKTKAIVPVHLFGQPANMKEITDLAKKHDLYVIEDNAQAIGAKCFFNSENSAFAGTLGNIGTTSFFPSKNLGGYGDGGALMTNDNGLAQKISMIVNHGSRKKYYHDLVGVNSRLDTLQAGILREKLKHLDDFIQRRQEAANFYSARLKDLPNIRIPLCRSGRDHVFHQYTLVFRGADRNAIREKLKEKGIPSMIYYPVPLSLQRAFSGLGYKKGDFPVTEMLCENVLSLPMHTELDQQQLEYITSTLVKIVE